MEKDCKTSSFLLYKSPFRSHKLYSKKIRAINPDSFSDLCKIRLIKKQKEEKKMLKKYNKN